MLPVSRSGQPFTSHQASHAQSFTPPHFSHIHLYSPGNTAWAPGHGGNSVRQASPESKTQGQGVLCQAHWIKHHQQADLIHNVPRAVASSVNGHGFAHSVVPGWNKFRPVIFGFPKSLKNLGTCHPLRFSLQPTPGFQASHSLTPLRCLLYRGIKPTVWLKRNRWASRWRPRANERRRRFRN